MRRNRSLISHERGISHEAGPDRGRRGTASGRHGVLVVPHLHLGTVTPLIRATPKQIKDYADTAPIFGWWNAHVGWGTIPAIAIGAAAVRWGPQLAQRLSWRSVTFTAWATAAAWAFALAMIDGWQRLRRASDRQARVPAPGPGHHRHP